MNKLIFATFLIAVAAVTVNGASPLGEKLAKMGKLKPPTNPNAPSAAEGPAVNSSKNMSDMMPAGMMEHAQSMLMAQLGNNKGRRDVHSSTEDETKKGTVAETTNNAGVKKTEKKEKKAKKVEVASIA